MMNRTLPGRLALAAGAALCLTAPVSAQTRSPWTWPFATSSIWNTPIGSGAQYVPAGIGAANFIGADDELLYQVPAGSPVRNVYSPATWGPGRCSKADGSNFLGTMAISDSTVVPDAYVDQWGYVHTPNNGAAFLMPDGATLIPFNELARCTAGGNVYGWMGGPVDITGPGAGGGHGGSGLSSIGGTIRLGELTASGPIRHALKLEIQASKYLDYDPNSPTPGYRWPATVCDNYANGGYGGSNPALVQGSLLAVPPSVTVSSLGLTNGAAIKIFHALQDYGGYIVDDTAWDASTVCVEPGVESQGGFSAGYSGTFHDEMNRIFQALSIVNNNGPNSVGGGGSRRAAAAPPLAVAQNFDTGSAPDWSPLSGTWQAANGVYSSADANAGLSVSLYAPSIYTNYTFQASAYPYWGNWFGVWYNYRDSRNYDELYLGTDGTAKLNKVVNGTATTVATGTYPGGGTYVWTQIKLTRSGGKTTVVINGQTVFSGVSQTEFSSGKVGLMANWNPVDFDNVSVQ